MQLVIKFVIFQFIIQGVSDMSVVKFQSVNHDQEYEKSSNEVNIMICCTVRFHQTIIVSDMIKMFLLIFTSMTIYVC